jgi:hypothetical protein
VKELEQRIEELRREEETEKIKSPLDGNELMALFQRPPGPWIKEVKDLLLNAVLDGDLAEEDKAGAEAMAKEFLARSQEPGARDHGPEEDGEMRRRSDAATRRHGGAATRRNGDAARAPSPPGRSPSPPGRA